MCFLSKSIGPLISIKMKAMYKTLVFSLAFFLVWNFLKAQEKRQDSILPISLEEIILVMILMESILVAKHLVTWILQ